MIPLLRGASDELKGLSAQLRGAEGKSEIVADFPQFSIGQASVLEALASELDGQVRTAGRRFTVAVVGEFKVGKSTFLNALLRLTGDAALSSGDNPDTACSILLRYRDAGTPEARLSFLDGTSQEVPWTRARQLTSQIHLNDHPADLEISRRLLEVEYFVASPVLAQLNLNDLPGTGSRYWKEHTAETHRRMKEADAVIWMVAEAEPSASAKQDLAILADCAQQVIPIVNVIEDPTATPPIERDQAAVDDISATLVREYRSFFAAGFEKPLEVSSKVAGLELVKPSPDPAVLASSGWAALEAALDDAFRAAVRSGETVRARRVANTAAEICARSQVALASALGRLNEWLPRLRARADAATLKLDDVEAIKDDVRARVRAVGRSRAAEICTRVGAQARNFVEDTVQLSNLSDLATALKKNGRSKLETYLKARFIRNYLQLEQEPNWLTALQRAYAEDVRATVMPAWRQILARLPEAAVDSRVELGSIDLERLGNGLLDGVIRMLGKVLGVVAVGVALAFIPGGQIIDAIGLLGMAAVSMFVDPLEGTRRRAADRARIQVELQQYPIQNGLFDAGMKGNDVIEKAVRAHLAAGEDRAGRNLLLVQDTREAVARCADNLKNTAGAVASLGGRAP